MRKELDFGQLPVRYVKDLGKGHGYMLFNYYAPLPFYIGAMLNKIGVNSVGALKRTYLIAITLGAIFMYLLVKKYFGIWAGIVSSGFYSLSPFFGMDIYSRGGLGEVWAISLMPMVLYFLTGFSEKPALFSLIFSSLAIAGLVLSHNLTSYMAIFVILFFVFLLVKNQKRRLLVFPFLLGLGLSAFFWLPSFVEKNYIWVWYMEKNISEYQNYFLPYEILYSPKSFFGISYLTPFYGLGLIWIIVIAFFRKKRMDRIFILSFLVSFLSLLLVFPVSKPVWNIFSSTISIVQFPWRFLTIYTVFLPLLLGFALSEKGKAKYVLGTLILLTAVVTSINSFRPLKYEFVDKYRAEDPCGTTWGYEYLPVWTKICLKQFPDLKFDFFEGEGIIKPIINADRNYKFEVEVKENSILRINEYYYPGWKAYINGKEVPVNYSNFYGIISLSVNKGKSLVELRLKETPVADFSDKVSLFCLISIVLTALGKKLWKFRERMAH